jgi:transposase
VSVSMSAPMIDDRSFHVLEAVPSRLEVSSHRRRWSAEAKARLVEETLQAGANVSAIARQAGMSPSQLFGWRRKAIRSGVVEPRADADRLGFVEVSAARTSMVEICLDDIVIRTGADVDFDHLLKVIRVVRQA